jgi:ADP-heptose:LPS heptosyltransferase
MKTLVLTKKTKNESEIEELTIPRIKDYAQKTNSDFQILEDFDEVSKFWEISNLLGIYDRLLYISPFILIRPDAPNLFDIVPNDKLGIFNEGRYINRATEMKAAMIYYRQEIKKDWDSEYYNFDILLASKKNRLLFKKPNYEEVGLDLTPYINLMIHNNEISVFNLDFKFNRKEFLDDKIGISRLDSYMINYTDAPKNIIKDIIEKDIKQWKEDSPNYQYTRNIIIRLSAGMGDQIDSEPVARYVKKLYPEANIYLTTHFPRAFKHLKKYGIEVSSYDDWKGLNDAAIIFENKSKSVGLLSHPLFHPTDFSAMSMIRRNLPIEEKQIMLEVDAVDIKNLLELSKNSNTNKKKIIVHAGKWWDSKTFPKHWWQKVVDLLSEKLCVVLIGQTKSEKQGYVDIDCPKDGLDLRDMTNLGELIALISLCKVTLTNDSSPIHIAGAFDNWIVLIPTCKHPDNTLPYRNSSTRYKTKALYKKLLVDDLDLRHTEFNFDSIDKIPKGAIIEDYIPEPEKVAEEIFDIYFNKD